MGAVSSRTPRAGALLAFLVCVLAIAAALVPTSALAATVTFETADGRQAKEDSALLKDVDFGLNGFERNAKGTARAMKGQPDGYRFPLLEDSTLVVVRTPENVIVWVDASAAARAGFKLDDASAQRSLKTMLQGLDETHSMGGALLSDVADPWVFTTDESVTQGDYTYRFRVQGETGTGTPP